MRPLQRRRQYAIWVLRSIARAIDMTARSPDHHGPHGDAEPAATHPRPARELTHAEVRGVVIGIAVAMFLGALDQTIVATALPTIGQHFGDVENLAWVVTAYLLTGMAVTPLSGKLSDIYGRRLLMLIGIAIFLVGSVACALAPNMLALIVARAVQGLGGGGLIALAQTIIADIVTPRERGRYQGYISAVFAISSVGGPVLGGFLTEHLDWSLIFWINLPIGMAAFVACNHVLRRVPYQPRRHALDILGALLMMTGAVLLLLALTWGGRRYAWVSVPIGALLIGSAAVWLLFAWRLVSAREPFLPLAVLGNPVVRSAVLSGACAMGALVGMTIFVPLYFEVVQGLSASQSGLALIPLMSCTVIAATLAGQALMYVTHYKPMGVAGFIEAIVALSALALWPGTPPMGWVLVLLAVTGLGIGLVFPIATVAMQNAVSTSQMGIATGAGNFFRSLIASIVVAVLGAIVLGSLGGDTSDVAIESLAQAAAGHDLVTAFRFVFLTVALVLAFGVCFLIAMEERPLRGPAADPPRLMRRKKNVHRDKN
jgi:EmrB/QacA subfamily drug resistance transporter